MSSVTGPFRRLLLVPATLMLVVTASGLFAAVKEAPTVTSSIIVVFKSAILPADASQRIQQAGGTVVRALDQVGIVVAVPTSTNAATLIQNLLNDSTVLDADYDRIVDLIAPTQVATESYPVIPDDHFPHPFPFPPEAADWFYTDTAQMWSVKRVGAQGGGIPGGSGGAWDTTFGAGV